MVIFAKLNIMLVSVNKPFNEILTTSITEHEIWVDVVGYEGIYQVSNLGRVKSFGIKKKNNVFIKKDTIIKSRKYRNKNVLALNKNKSNEISTFYVEKIVAKAFILNPDNKKFVLHKDGNVLNDFASNLEWTNIRDGQTKYPKEIRELAIKDYLDGKNTQELMEKYEASDTVIRNWILKSGNKMRTTASYKRVGDDIRKSIILDFNKGLNSIQLSKKYNLCTRFITDLLKENGLEYRLVPPNKRQELKDKAIDLYVNQNLNCCDISKIIGISSRSVLDWMIEAGVNRSMSETNCLLAQQGKKKNHGKQSKLFTRFGIIRCDSSYERERLINLHSDENIKSVIRCKFRIPYYDNDGKKHHYNPDFFIEMNDGSLIVEEVKPKDMIHKLLNPIKHSVAKKYCDENGYKFRVVTEKEIFLN